MNIGWAKDKNCQGPRSTTMICMYGVHTYVVPFPHLDNLAGGGGVVVVMQG